MKWTPDGVAAAMFTLDDPCPHKPATVAAWERSTCPVCIADALNTAFEMGRDAERADARKGRK